ncbi:hypothetical protein O181_099231 [Austropuccinia psidii MF-1]|uniref:Uncharacterized protein n=1 Tax=Austropuccinia psidii MF-1 TaxID=1389203 RepID=A0A9Q3JD15_9BASI|nr:hypothetical protein [Austropuccinia psidii MF-1]
MNTRRGFKYSIQSDGGRLRIINNPKKGKRKGKIPSGTESTQESAISQRKVSEMTIISEPKLELMINTFNICKSHSEGSDRHLNEPIQAVIQGVQGKILANVATNPSRSDELLAYHEKFPQKGGNSDILQWMESTIIQI